MPWSSEMAAIKSSPAMASSQNEEIPNTYMAWLIVANKSAPARPR